MSPLPRTPSRNTLSPENRGSRESSSGRRANTDGEEGQAVELAEGQREALKDARLFQGLARLRCALGVALHRVRRLRRTWRASLRGLRLPLDREDVRLQAPSRDISGRGTA